MTFSFLGNDKSKEVHLRAAIKEAAYDYSLFVSPIMLFQVIYTSSSSTCRNTAVRFITAFNLGLLSLAPGSITCFNIWWGTIFNQLLFSDSFKEEVATKPHRRVSCLYVFFLILNLVRLSKTTEAVGATP